MADSSTQLAFLVIVFGLMGNFMNISLNTQAIDIENGYGKNIINSFHGLWSLAGFTGAGVGAIMINYEVGPMTHYLFVGSIGILVVSWASFYIRPEQEGATSPQLILKRPDPLLLRIGLVGFCGMLCEGCMFDWSGIYMAKEIGAAPRLVPFGFFAFMGAMAIGRFLADRVANSVGKITVLKFSGALICLGLLIPVLIPHFWAAIIGFTAVGLGTAAVIPLSYSIAGRSDTYPPSVAIALVSTLSFFGFLIGPPLIGFVAEIFNLKTSFFVIAIMGSIITLLVSVRKQLLVLGVKN